MRRRALLTMLAPAFAGCSLAPSGPSTESYPATNPNIFASFDWDPDRSTLTVTFERGNRLTAENTERLAVVTEDGDGGETVWVGPEGTDPAAAFPLSPGATVAHELSTPARTHLDWTPAGESSWMPVAVWNPEEEMRGADE
ncbi:hypothetical protein [Halorubrum sp. AS12]|uniref:hypothetical protein n=1 Tax=Halorubrum sp. AS12 TaxID=3409687 RepID=UPI003DA6DFB1